jgi:hypothetical protein
MIQTKRVIFMILPLLFVPVVYSISSTPDACAVPPDENFGSTPECSQSHIDPNDPNSPFIENCCWTEENLKGEMVKLCQSCELDDSGRPADCSAITQRVLPASTDVLPEGGVIQQPQPTPPLTGGNGIFGSNILPTPSLAPDDGSGTEQPPLTTPISPIAPPTIEPPSPPTNPTIAPEGDQGDEGSGTDGGNGGGGQLPGKDLPETGITEQPEVKQPSNEGQGPAGPLT